MQAKRLIQFYFKVTTMIIGIDVPTLTRPQVYVNRHCEILKRTLLTCLCNAGNVVYPRVEFRSIPSPLDKVLHPAMNSALLYNTFNRMALWWNNPLQFSAIEGAFNVFIIVISQLVLSRRSN